MSLSISSIENEITKNINLHKRELESSNSQAGYHINKLFFVTVYRIMTQRIYSFCNL